MDHHRQYAPSLKSDIVPLTFCSKVQSRLSNILLVDVIQYSAIVGVVPATPLNTSAGLDQSLSAIGLRHPVLVWPPASHFQTLNSACDIAPSIGSGLTSLSTNSLGSRLTLSITGWFSWTPRFDVGTYAVDESSRTS